MNLRKAGYNAYGFSEGEEKHLLKQCQTGGIDPHTVLECAIEANPGYADELFFSLIKGVSYEKLDFLSHLPASKNDFYAYRRKTLALIRKRIGVQNKIDGGIE